MNASEVMDSNPSTLKPDDSVEYAVQFIMQKRYRNLPVIDDTGCYLGMFGVNCLLRQVLPKAVFMDRGLKNVGFIHESLGDLYKRYAVAKDEPISSCMSTDIKSVFPFTPLTETLLQLYDTRFSIPVVEPDSCKLLGMISYWDVGQKILQAGEIMDA
jgi:CBS-domain-containing membrane protein